MNSYSHDVDLPLLRQHLRSARADSRADYVRIAALVVGVFFMTNSPVVFICCYAFSALCDAVDGNLARHFNQCPRARAHPQARASAPSSTW